MFGVIHRFCRLAPAVFTLVAGAAQGQNLISALPEHNATPTTQVVTQATAADLSLRKAVSLTLKLNPELAAAAKEMGALEGVVQQVDLLRNPELDIETEDIGASRAGGLQRFTTIRLSQVIELGGKRQARTRVAALAQDIAGQDYAAKRLAVLARVANLFTDVLAAQERTRLSAEGVQLAETVATAVGKRVLAGKAPPIEETKSRLTLSSARIELVQAQRELTATRKQLSLLWGDAEPLFNRALGDMATTVTLPSLALLEQRVRDNPLAARSQKNVAQRQALLQVEQSKRVPDITLKAGVRRFSQTGENTSLLGIAIPLPLFDRNQGNLREAYQRLDQAQDERAATDLRQQSELALTYESLLAAQHEIGVLREEILPAAKSAFDVANRGYELGKFGFLDILDAQRTLAQNQMNYVRALANYQKLVHELERLTAMPLDTRANTLNTAVE